LVKELTLAQLADATASSHVLYETYMQLMERFIASQDVAPTSRITYRNCLARFFDWLSKISCTAPTRETILQYKAHLDAIELKPFTRSNYLVVVRKFFEWTEHAHLYPNVARGIKGAKKQVKAHQKSSLSIFSIKLLFASIDQETLQGKRDFALINLLIRTGLRLIELVRANIADLVIDTDQAVLWVRGKGREGKDEFVVLTQECIQPISRYLLARHAAGNEEPLFGSCSDRNFNQRLTIHSVSRMIKEYLRAIGVHSERVTAHSLRHTFGVLAIQAGSSLYEVQLAMRHASPLTTELYLGDIERIKRLEASPEKKVREYLKSSGI
jgi:integrase/recombinase XerD